MVELYIGQSYSATPKP